MNSSLTADCIHSSMEAVKKKVRVDEEANLAANRNRFNKLLLIFKLFFISLTLIMAALITYLLLSEQSIHHNPSPQISTTDSQIFKLSLQRAAQELENATLLLSNASNELACRKWLLIGSGQLRGAIRADPFPLRPSIEQRAEMASRVEAAEVYIASCLDDLQASTMAAANDLRDRVSAAAAYLSERGDFLMSYGESRESVWDLILENLIVISLFAFQMVFIFFLFWTIFKSP